MLLNGLRERVSNEDGRMTQQEKETEKGIGRGGQRLCSVYRKPQTNKKGFRIDDILFNVSNKNNNKLRQNTSCLFLDSSPASEMYSLSSSCTSPPHSPCHESGNKSGNRASLTMLRRARSRSPAPSLPHSSSKYTQLCIANGKFIKIVFYNRFLYMLVGYQVRIFVKSIFVISK